MTTEPPIQTSFTPLLPAILCLHGGGSNSTVFKIQCRRLIWALKPQFRFIFAQAPIEGIPGHGMLPVFASCAPFYRWVSHRFTGEDDKEIAPASEVNVLDEVIRGVMEANGGAETFVGVLGFSQGARLVAGLMLRQLMAERDGRACFTKFKFGVMIGGPAPPIALLDEGSELDPRRDYELLRNMPSVHAWGREDHIKAGCVVLADLCESDVAFQMDFNGGHHLPLKDGEARDLCDLIMAAWFAGGGRREVGAEEKY